MNIKNAQKVVKAARTLSKQLRSGSGPKLGRERLFTDGGRPCCAMGHLLHKAGVTGKSTASGMEVMEEILGVDHFNVLGATVAVEEINDSYEYKSEKERKREVAKALTELADEIEEVMDA